MGGGGAGPAGPEDPSLEEQDGSSLLFDEPIPRKRKVGGGVSRRGVRSLFLLSFHPSTAGLQIPSPVNSICQTCCTHSTRSRNKIWVLGPSEQPRKKERKLQAGLIKKLQLRVVAEQEES